MYLAILAARSIGWVILILMNRITTSTSYSTLPRTSAKNVRRHAVCCLHPESKIAFFYFLFFFRIGTFQRVTVDSNKKIPLKSRLASQVVQETSKPRIVLLRSPRDPIHLIARVFLF
jgi:hypothetical protein